MDILDILIARAKSFTGETARLTRQAQEAMAKANEVTTKIDQAQDALDAANAANEAADAANTRAQEVADQFDEIAQDLNTAMETAASAIIDEKIATATSAIAADAADAKAAAAAAVTNVEVITDNNNTVKAKKTRVYKNNSYQDYDTTKNYTTTGQNEDGAMTQKAITTALNSLENRINNIPSGGGGSGTGNVSGNITSADEGSIVTVDENGDIAASSITENDVILTQIIAGTYHNDNIAGIEIDYINRNFTRLQGAANLTAGENFNKFNAFGGRKRCIVNDNGQIVKFISSEDEITEEKIMVYQPAFYYLRIPLSVTETATGTRINKEQIYVADKKYAGFKLHPAFYDKFNNPVKYILLSAFEGSGYRVNGGNVKNDANNLDYNNDKLTSIINSKPISNISIMTGETMAENIGQGWSITKLAHASLNQMLMIIEFGSLNIQSSFNLGITQISGTSDINCASITGSTLSLGNNSGQAAATVNTQNNTSNTYTTAGKCAISYRGVENPYGNIWQLVADLKIINATYIYNNETLAFTMPTSEDWIGALGYDKNIDWVFLPITSENAGTSSLPIGDYIYPNISNIQTGCVIGGTCRAELKTGIFCYGFDASDARPNYSVRIYHTPIANSTIETHNYNLWLNN